MKVSQGSQPQDFQNEQAGVQGKSPRQDAQLGKKNTQTKLGGGLNQQDISFFQEQMRMAGAQQAMPVTSKFGQDQGEGGDGETGPDMFDLKDARLLATTDPSESRQITVSNPSDLFASSKQVSTEARVDKALNAIATQVEQTIRAEAMADKSDGRMLTLSLDSNKYGIAGLKILSTGTSMSIVLERVGMDGGVSDLQIAAQSLLANLQTRFPDRKIRILDRVGEGETEVAEVDDQNRSSISAILSGQGLL